jgi:hypothetical protein
VSAQLDTTRVFQRITASIWRRMAPTFGVRTINAIAKNAIVRTARVHPYLNHLEIAADNGLDWGKFEGHIDEVHADEVSTMLGDLMDEFFDGLSTLTGQLIADKIFSEAEKESGKDPAS